MVHHLSGFPPHKHDTHWHPRSYEPKQIHKPRTTPRMLARRCLRHCYLDIERATGYLDAARRYVSQEYFTSLADG